MAKAMYIGAERDYALLEYIESTGTQYINTNYTPNTDTRVLLEGSFAKHADDDDYTAVFGAYSNGEPAFGFGYRNQNVYSYLNTIGLGSQVVICDGAKHTIDFSPAKLSIDEQVCWELPNMANPSWSLFLFAANNNGAVWEHSAMRLYSCKIYEGDTLVRDFVPGKNASGAVGLYDMVEGKFYGNSGSGAFIAGTEVSAVGESVAHNIIAPFIGIDGVARTIIQACIGDENGIARLLYEVLRYVWKKYSILTTYKWKKYNGISRTYYSVSYGGAGTLPVKDSDRYYTTNALQIDTENGTWSTITLVGTLNNCVGSWATLGSRSTAYYITYWDKNAGTVTYSQSAQIVSNTRFENSGTLAGNVTSTNSDEYPANGQKGSYWYVSDGSTQSAGDYIEDVTSADPNAYPNNAASGSYWYIKQ